MAGEERRLAPPSGTAGERAHALPLFHYPRLAQPVKGAYAAWSNSEPL